MSVAALDLAQSFDRAPSDHHARPTWFRRAHLPWRLQRSFELTRLDRLLPFSHP